MKGSLDPALKAQIKDMIVAESDTDILAQSILDDEPLFGDQSRIGLDSLDAIQLSMAIQRRYGVKITDSKEARRVFACVNQLAELVQPT